MLEEEQLPPGLEHALRLGEDGIRGSMDTHIRCDVSVMQEKSIDDTLRNLRFHGTTALTEK